MESVKAYLRKVLARLDALGEGGGPVAVQVAAALATAEGKRRGDLTGFAELEKRLWPEHG